ncbi:MAG TPA: M20/M25/M40 family metallo-hydrolase [Phycisphaerae bacterium]|nr:M20/M25/M40 family metallo-hydrolase [Phycisphaerae bacterium]HPS53170.1 M20/M25/M40 family metallo-hydrolase [Phycisphaerae bacterium]
MRDAVLERLASGRGRFLDELITFLKFQSIAECGNRKDCVPCAEWLADLLERIGFDGGRILAGDCQPCVYAEKTVSADVPTILFYGHYDVQPADPLDEWETPPFDPQIIDDYIYARGASDNKGQIMTWLRGLETLIAAGELSMNVKVLLEGGEEIGSPGMAEVVLKNRQLLRADAVVASDMAWYADGVPSMTNMLRGLCAYEIIFRGPASDVHSGMYGGLVVNPINELAALIASFHDASGRIAIPGFYDDVQDVPQEQLKKWEKLSFDEPACAKVVGLNSFAGGEAGLEPIVRMWARPTLDCNGIVGGHTGSGSKTIIPAKASVKISTRLVADQEPDRIESLLREFIFARVPAGIKCEFVTLAKSKAVIFPTDTPLVRRAAAAMEKVFGKAPVFVGSGGSVPITSVLSELAGGNVFFMNLGLPDDRIHSPNERFRLDFFDRGAEMVCRFLGSDTFK